MAAERTVWQESYGFGRPMSEMEYGMHVYHKHEMWIILGTLIVQCDTVPSIEQMNNSLVELMRWNPSLRMSIRRQTDGWHFVEDVSAKPRLVCNYNEQDLKKVMESELQNPIEDDNAPQLRCTYLPNVTYQEESQHSVQLDTNRADGTVESVPVKKKSYAAILLTANHCIMDGISGMSVIKMLLRILNDVTSGRTTDVKPFTTMYPPSEHYFMKAFDELGQTEEGRQRQNHLVSFPGFSLDVFCRPNDCLFTNLKPAEAVKDPSIPNRPQFHLIEMLEKEIQQIRKVCRAKQVPLQSAVQIAGAVAIARLLQRGDEWNPMDISYYMATNLRDHIAKDVPMDYAGYYISLLFGFNAHIKGDLDATTAQGKEEFWEMAQKSAQNLRQQLLDKRYLEGFFGFKGFGEPDMKIDVERFKTKSEGRTPEVLYTTSMSQWDLPTTKEDPLKPVAVFLTSSVHRGGPVFDQTLVTINGKLCWSVSWSPRVLTRDTADWFITNMLQVLREAVRKSQL